MLTLLQYRVICICVHNHALLGNCYKPRSLVQTIQCRVVLLFEPAVIFGIGPGAEVPCVAGFTKPFVTQELATIGLDLARLGQMT